jgi:hypothetical protein
VLRIEIRYGAPASDDRVLELTGQGRRARGVLERLGSEREIAA